MTGEYICLNCKLSTTTRDTILMCGSEDAPLCIPCAGSKQWLVFELKELQWEDEDEEDDVSTIQ